MRKAVSLLLSAVLILGLLPACRGSEPSEQSPAPEREWTAADLLDVAFQASGFEESNEFEHLYIDQDREQLDVYLENAYGLEDWADAAVSRAMGASAFEIAVVRVEDDGAAVRAATAFMSYISNRQGDFTGYAPDQADMAANGEILQVGPYAGLFICPDPQGASNAVAEALGGETHWESTVQPTVVEEDSNYPGRVKFTPPNTDDMSLYDTSAIRAAWEEGDPSQLSREDGKIYTAARKVLEQELEDGMSDYEKEFAIYSWIVNNVDYEWIHQRIGLETPRTAFTPYGALVSHKAVCLGYATAFQLLCDLAGVECITVTGAAFQSQEDHGWNMVRLNGEWYCVDATWDANARERVGLGKPEDWDYFNVTSDRMADSNHQWDYANTPEATATDHGLG